MKVFVEYGYREEHAGFRVAVAQSSDRSFLW